jgi:ribosomal-protein-alanine N-acetyltransferase
MDYSKLNANYINLTSSPSSNSPNPFAGHALPSLDLLYYQLRAIQASDLPSWYDYLILPAVREHSSWVVKSPADLQQFIQLQDWTQMHAQIKFAIADREDHLIGTIGFHSVSLGNLSAEIAYDLSPTHWGKGIVSAACRSLTNWAHQKLGFVRIQACVVDSNVRSLQVLQRCDFEKEGLLKSYKQLQGKSRNYWILSHCKCKAE